MAYLAELKKLVNFTEGLVEHEDDDEGKNAIIARLLEDKELCGLMVNIPLAEAEEGSKIALYLAGDWSYGGSHPGWIFPMDIPYEMNDVIGEIIDSFCEDNLYFEDLSGVTGESVPYEYETVYVEEVKYCLGELFEAVLKDAGVEDVSQEMKRTYAVVFYLICIGMPIVGFHPVFIEVGLTY